MDSPDEFMLAVFAFIGWMILFYVSTHFVRVRLQRRTFELTTAHNALKAHYDSLSRLSEQTGLSGEDAAFLASFTEAVSDEKTYLLLTDGVVEGQALDRPDSPAFPVPAEEKDTRTLFNVAVSTGLVALFLRWPKTAWRLHRFAQQTAADPVRPIKLARELVSARNRLPAG